MKKTNLIPVLCLVMAAASGCVVMKGKYDAALADLESTRAELDSARTQSQMLTQEATELEQLKAELARQFETATAALQQAKQSIEAEQAASQRQLNQLSQKISQLHAQGNSLKHALQRAQDERPALQATVDKFKAKLGDGDGPRAPSFSTFPPPAPLADSPGMPPVAAVQNNTAPDPAVAPAAPLPAIPANQTAAKPSPATTPASEPSDEGLLSAIKGWVLSLWRSIFS